MQTIYEPKGKALEYAPLALNIYSGCSHGCTYCYMRPMHERFYGAGSFDTPVYREGLYEALVRTLHRDMMQSGEHKYIGKTIHLCFSCDPYPAGIDTTPTREVIKLLKEAGCHVQILTKGGARAERDFDLLDGEDWFGVTITGDESQEPGAASEFDRVCTLYKAHQMGFKTWISHEPVYNADAVYSTIESADWVDRIAISKLNYHQGPIDNWAAFGRECERRAKQYGRNIYIKAELRAEMERVP